MTFKIASSPPKILKSIYLKGSIDPYLASTP